MQAILHPDAPATGGDLLRFTLHLGALEGTPEGTQDGTQDGTQAGPHRGPKKDPERAKRRATMITVRIPILFHQRDVTTRKRLRGSGTGSGAPAEPGPEPGASYSRSRSASASACNAGNGEDRQSKEQNGQLQQPIQSLKAAIGPELTKHFESTTNGSPRELEAGDRLASLIRDAGSPEEARALALGYVMDSRQAKRSRIALLALKLDRQDETPHSLPAARGRLAELAARDRQADREQADGDQARQAEALDAATEAALGRLSPKERHEREARALARLPEFARDRIARQAGTGEGLSPASRALLYAEIRALEAEAEEERC